MKKLKIAVSAAAVVSTGLMGAAIAQAGASRSLSDEAAVRLSYSALSARAAEYGIVSPKNELRPRMVTHDRLNHTHVRLDQVYRGLPVFGEQLVTHLDAAGRLYYVSGSFAPIHDLSVRPTLSPSAALDIALADFAHGVSETPQVDLVVFTYERTDPVLAYKILVKDIESDAPASWTYFINAHSGDIEFDFDSLETAPAAGIGNTVYSGSVEITTESTDTGFQMTDSTRGGITTSDLNHGTSGNGETYADADNIWGDGTTADSASLGADAHYGSQMTWDYYLNTYGRSGLRNDGVGNLARVHYSTGYVNAFWDDSCFCMTYGDGDGSTSDALVTLDVAGHEMTHGLTSVTAGLIYAGQSGGLNESMSDIFGTAVEFYAESVGAQTVGEYWLGEDCWTPSVPEDALRYLDDPTRDGISIDNAKRYHMGLDVHYSSGVSNNVFYLASEGGTNRTSGQSVTGIGRQKVEAIFYQALTNYMTPTTNWKKAKQYTVQAATELYGQAEANAISSAWSACGVR